MTRRPASVAVGCALTLALAGCGNGPGAVSGVSGAGSDEPSANSWADGRSEATVTTVPSADDVLAEGEWGTLLSSLGDEAVAFGRRVQGELPVTAYAQWSGVGGGEAVELDEAGQVRALFNALASASLGDKAKELRTDDYTSFWFVFSDGTRFSVSFDSLTVTLPGDASYTAYAVDAGDDFRRFAEMARQRTLKGYES